MSTLAEARRANAVYEAALDLLAATRHLAARTADGPVHYSAAWHDFLISDGEPCEICDDGTCPQQPTEEVES